MVNMPVNVEVCFHRIFAKRNMRDREVVFSHHTPQKYFFKKLRKVFRIVVVAENQTLLTVHTFDDLGKRRRVFPRHVTNEINLIVGLNKLIVTLNDNFVHIIDAIEKATAIVQAFLILKRQDIFVEKMMVRSEP